MIIPVTIVGNKIMEIVRNDLVKIHDKEKELVLEEFSFLKDTDENKNQIIQHIKKEYLGNAISYIDFMLEFVEKNKEIAEDLIEEFSDSFKKLIDLQESYSEDNSKILFNMNDSFIHFFKLNQNPDFINELSELVRKKKAVIEEEKQNLASGKLDASIELSNTEAKELVTKLDEKFFGIINEISESSIEKFFPVFKESSYVLLSFSNLMIDWVEHYIDEIEHYKKVGEDYLKDIENVSQENVRIFKRNIEFHFKMCRLDLGRVFHWMSRMNNTILNLNITDNSI